MLFFCRNMEKWCFCCCYMFFYRSLPFLAREMGWVADLDGAGVGHQIDLLRSSHVVSSAPLQKRHIMTNIEKRHVYKILQRYYKDVQENSLVSLLLFVSSLHQVDRWLIGGW
jgi:hypothetical protein